MSTPQKTQAIKDGALTFMTRLFIAGRVWRPSDLDPIVGSGEFEAMSEIMGMEAPRFNRSPFGRALATLVDSGVVRAWRDEEDGGWCYELAKIIPQ